MTASGAAAWSVVSCRARQAVWVVEVVSQGGQGPGGCVAVESGQVAATGLVSLYVIIRKKGV